MQATYSLCKVTTLCKATILEAMSNFVQVYGVVHAYSFVKEYKSVTVYDFEQPQTVLGATYDICMTQDIFLTLCSTHAHCNFVTLRKDVNIAPYFYSMAILPAVSYRRHY